MVRRCSTACGAVIAAFLIALPHDHGAQGAAAAGGPDGHVSPDTANPAPGVGGAWAALKGARDEIAKRLDSGRLEEIHAVSEQLAPLANTLLERSSDLAPDNRARVEGAVKQMPKLADALHDAADAGNADETRRQLKRLDGLLDLVQTQYPASALTTSGTPANGPAGHSMSEHAMPGHDMAAHEHMEPHAHATRPLAAVDGQADWIHLHAAADATDAGTYRIDQPGRYRLLCTIPGHTEAGMVGELVVR